MKAELSKKQVERWDFVELSARGPRGGNPFVDVDFSCEFKFRHRVVEVDGFYDGDGTFRVRFMPDVQGEWTYTTKSNTEALNGISGRFSCVGPTGNNHGPVRVRDSFHFAYEDGTPYLPFGTTCYAWIHQGSELEEETLATLRESPFNKLRMCVFPKSYTFNKNEPEHYPFTGSLEEEWDFERFNPEFFQHLEKRIADLRELGIEADLILFHPYDRWGYDAMGREADDRYLRYIVARLGAYRNIWWSLANEYDLMDTKDEGDWDRFFRIIQETDPYQHLRSIHNCREFYDHGKPWVTHASIQRSDLSQVTAWRKTYRKPIVVDECRYEGNIPNGWGNITAQDMVHKFWEGFLCGGYVGHGETYVHPDDILWWSKGGILHGKSPERIAFLKEIVDESFEGALEPTRLGRTPAAGSPDDTLLIYYGADRSAYQWLELPEDREYMVEIIDTWEMTVEQAAGTFSGRSRIDLPGKQYIALRLTKR